MKRVSLTEKTSLEDMLKQVGEEDVVLLRDGHAIALFIPFDDDDLEWYARERDPAFVASLTTARQQIKQGHSISHEELKKELGLD